MAIGPFGVEVVSKGLPSALRSIHRANLIPNTMGQKGINYVGPRVAAHRRGQEAAKRTYKIERADGKTTMTGISNSGAMLLREGRWDRATSRARLSSF